MSQESRPRPEMDLAGDAFLAEVRRRVTAEIPISMVRGDPRLWRKAALIALAFAGSYAAMLAAPSTWAFSLASAAFALASAAMALNIFHDANHGAFSVNGTVNLWVARLCCTCLGVGRYYWRFKHQVLHHRGPNLWTWDDDVESRGFLRVSPQQPWRPRFRGQHFFVLPLYALNSVEWIFAKDFVQYVRGRINPYRATPSMPAADHMEFWICKALYFGLIVLPPFLVQPFPRALIGLAVFHIVLSLPITIVFQLAHLNDRVDFPAFDAKAEAPRPDDVFAQMRATSNFATGDPAIGWLLGGLNFQIEHHLLPAFSHTTYPQISRIVRDAAQRHGLPYIEHRTLGSALLSHLRLLKSLSRQQTAPPRSVVPGRLQSDCQAEP